MPSWTSKQKEAIDDRGNSLLVSAAAGSGKTAVLVERIKKLIFEDGISLDRMLIVTFTKAAASEMKERLRDDLNNELSLGISDERKDELKRQLSLLGRADICTFDSFAQKIVKSYYHVIGIDPDLKICDNYKSSILKDETLEEIFNRYYEKKDKDFFYFLDHYSTSKTDYNARELILNLYSYADTLPDPKAFLSDPLFDSEKLFEIACLECIAALDKSKRYLKILSDYFNMNDVKSLRDKADEAWSLVDSIYDELKGGNAENAIARMASFKFPQLRASKADGEWKKLHEDEIKALWDKGAKDVFNKAAVTYGKLSIAALEAEKKDIQYPLSVLCRFTLEFAELYAKKKLKAGLMDFSDAEHFAIDILKNEDVRKECQEKYLQIFVDEYQDSNPVQDALISSISSGDNIFMVGDVKQSIYKFRHAEPELFLEKYEKFKAGLVSSSKTIDLNSNFRSKPLVIDFINRVFERIMTKESCGMVYDDDAALKEGSPYTGSFNYEPEMYIVDTEESDDIDEELANMKKNELEALLACEVIKKYHGSEYTAKDGSVKKLEYKDMAVLLRSVKGKAETFYDIFTRAGIPVYLERNEGYFDTPEIQVFLNLIRVIDNFRQDVALLSVLHFPSFGFSSEELAKIRVYANENAGKKLSYADAFREYEKVKKDELSSRCSAFLEKIERWRVMEKALPLADFLWQLLSESGILLFAASLSGGKQRLANLRALVEKASEYEENQSGGLSGFVSYIELISDDKAKVSTGQSGMVSEGDNVLRIMTVHKSKGLEFPFVMVSSTHTKVSGGKSKGRTAYHKDLGCSMVLSNPKNFSYTKPFSYKLIRAKEKKEELAEELRILYVAATRARDILVFTGAVSGSSKLVGSLNELSVKGADCSSFMEMMLPYFEAGNIKITPAAALDISAFSKATSDRAAMARTLEEGFDIDESKMSMPASEIQRRLEYPYEPGLSESSKRKYSVSEIAEEERKTERRYREDFSVPSFAKGEEKLTSAQLGSAYHLVLETIPFDASGKDCESIEAHISDMVEKGLLEEKTAAELKAGRIERFFSSDLGKRITSASLVRKETPFVMKYDYRGREILVQGVIDCYFIEDGKLYLVDYKSNYVNMKDEENEILRLADEYRPQLAIYRDALEKITGMKVEGSYLYLISADRYIDLNQAG